MKAAASTLFALLAVVLPARADEVVGVSPAPIALEASKGELVRLARAATTVFVAQPEIADVQVKSPRLIYVFGKKPGETTLYAVDENERVLTSRNIVVSHNLTRLRDALSEMLPDARIDVRSVEGSVVLSGDAASAAEVEDARRLARRLVRDDESVVVRVAVTAPNQVQLRVRVAEVSRDVLKTLGINWDAMVGIGNLALGLFTGNPVLAAGTTFLSGTAGGQANTRNQGTNSLFGSFRSKHLDVNGLVDALNSEGLISILAEPNLTAVSGEQATFLAGGEFPVPVPDSDGRVTITFKQFGVSLAFKPVLTGENHISLKVNPEVSQLSNTGAVTLNGFLIPALTTRRALTTVELGSGQSFVIAGLLQNNITHDLSKLPGLGELPVLGPLFRSDRFRRNESELVIIVTPYIVRPVSAPMLASPTDGMRPPSDADRVLYGRSNAVSANRPSNGPAGSNGQGIVGSVGYVLE
jgi:pilus assembly protein CpaC